MGFWPHGSARYIAGIGCLLTDVVVAAVAVVVVVVVVLVVVHVVVVMSVVFRSLSQHPVLCLCCVPSGCSSTSPSSSGLRRWHLSEHGPAARQRPVCPWHLNAAVYYLLVALRLFGTQRLPYFLSPDRVLVRAPPPNRARGILMLRDGLGGKSSMSFANAGVWVMMVNRNLEVTFSASLVAKAREANENRRKLAAMGIAFGVFG